MHRVSQPEPIRQTSLPVEKKVVKSTRTLQSSTTQGGYARPASSHPQPWEPEPETRIAPVYDAEVTLEKPEPRRGALLVELSESAFNSLQEEMYSDVRLTFTTTVKDQRTLRQFSDEETQPLRRQFYLSMNHALELGHRYTITLRVTKSSIYQQRTLHKEVFSKSELEELMDKAANYKKGRLQVTYAYRNKPFPYWENVKRKGSIMEVYIKDENGDPGCPINGQIKGLFFGVRPNHKTGQPLPAESLFGQRRIYLSVEDLIKPHLRMYFADFWCHKLAHHVTLVVTKPHSAVDKFCSENLLKIPMTNNPFFYRQKGRGYFCCTVPEVEILYTENVDLKAPNITWATVPVIGKGSSTPGGIPKKRDCDICNLY